MKTLEAFEDNLHLKVVDDFYIQLRVASTTGWNTGDLIFLEVSSCTNNATRRLVDGPKKIYSIESSRVLGIKSYGLAADMDCGSGKIWLMKKEGAMKPNGIFTVTNSQGTTVQFSTGADSEHVGTWNAGGKAIVLGFDIEECSGIITVASDAINYEYTKPQVFDLQLQIRAEHSINTASVVVTVNNVDEAPYLVQLPTPATVDECFGSTCITGGASHNLILDGTGNTFMIDDPEGQNDFTLEVLDDAGNRNGAGVRTWTISNAVPRTLTRIESAILDHETKSTYVLQIVATDNDEPLKLRTQVALTVTLIPINEPPTFAPLFLSVPESIAPGTNVQSSPLAVFDPENDNTTLAIMWGMTVTATNLHASNAGTMSSSDRPFTWHTGTPDANSSTKILQVGTSTIDHETIQLYSVVMKACDSGGLCTVSPYTSIDISITDVNEKPAWKANSYIYYVDENDSEGVVMDASHNGSAVGSLSLQVNDPDTSSTHTFSILADPDGSGVGVGGWLTTSVHLNNELGKPLRINVAAAKLSGTAPNYEFPPLLVSNGATPAGGNPTNPAAYKFNVNVIDNGGLAADGTTQIEIRIVDSNEPPSFTTEARRVNENSVSGTKVCAEGTCNDVVPDTKYTILDDDVGTSSNSGQTVTLSIVSGNLGSAFEIVPALDFFQVQVQTANINYEGSVGTSYFLGVTIIDVGGTGITDGETTTATIEIKIVDINDPPTLSAQSVSILKTAQEGDCVTPATFSGDDEDLPRQTLTYSLSEPAPLTAYHSGIFVASTVAGGRQGKMCIASTVLGGNNLESSAYKQANSPYYFTLNIADNSASPLSATAVLTLSIGDINAVPVYTPVGVCDVDRSLPENTLPGTVFGASIIATDPDDNDQLTMTMVNTADGKFDVVTPTARAGAGAGIWSFSTQIKPLVSLDYEAGTNVYTIRIRATDDKTVPSSVECDLTIRLTNINEPPSSVVVFNDALTVEENAAIHFKVGSVVATDEDRWQDLNWNLPIVGNPNPNPFYIKPRVETLSGVAGTGGSTFSTGRSLDVLSPSISGNPASLTSIPTMLSAATDDDWSTFVSANSVTGNSTLAFTTIRPIRPESIRIVLSGDPWKGGAFSLQMNHDICSSGSKCGGCDFNLAPPIVGTTTPSNWKVTTTPKEFVLTNCAVDATVDPLTAFNLQISSPDTVCPTTEAECRTWCESRGLGSNFVATSFGIYPLGCGKPLEPNTNQRCWWNTHVTGSTQFLYLLERCNSLRVHEVSMLVKAKTANIFVSGYAPIDYEALSSSIPSHTITLLVQVSDVGGTDNDGLTSSGTVTVAVADQAEPPFNGDEQTLSILENTASDANAPYQIGATIQPGDPDASGTSGHSYQIFRPGGMSTTSSCWKMTSYPGANTPIPVTFGVSPSCSFDAVIGVSSLRDFGLQLLTNVAPATREILMWKMYNNKMTLRLASPTNAIWNGTRDETIGDLTSTGILTTASCPWRNTACGDKSTWVALLTTPLAWKDCAEHCRMNRDCQYFQYGDRRDGVDTNAATYEGKTAANCWSVPTSYGKSCLNGPSGSKESKFVGSDLHFCQISAKKESSVWVSISAESVTAVGGCNNVTVSAGMGNTIGTDTLIAETIAGDLGPGLLDQLYRGEVFNSDGGNAVLSPMCFSSALAPQPHQLFDIGTDSGKIFLQATSGGTNSGFLNFETKAEYGILVVVTDSTSQNQTPSLVYRRITVTDVNEPPTWNYACPDDLSVIACLEIPEGTAAGTSVTQMYGGSTEDTSAISATDVDADDALTYSIVGGNTLVGTASLAFVVAGATDIGSNVPIVLKVASNGLDTEASISPWYDLLVQVSDSTSLTSQHTVRVYLKDVNEPPVLPSATFSVSEDGTGGTSWVLSGSDNDPTPSFSTLEYTIQTMPVNDLGLGGNAVASTTATGTEARNVLMDDDSKVWMPAANGENTSTLEIDLRKNDLVADQICLQFASGSEYGTPNRIELSIKATWEDSWSSQVVVPDGDSCGDGPTALFCHQSESYVRFVQFKFTGSCDPSRSTLHPDLAVRRIHVYGLDLFSVLDNMLSLSEINAVNFETYSNYIIGIRVTDGGELYADNNIVVAVTDVNEVPFVGIQRKTCVQGCNDVNRMVPEGSLETFQIGLPIPADDLDNVLQDVQALTYSMEVLDGLEVFAIHGCTGQLEVLLPMSLDHESKKSYTIRVKITDDGNPVRFATSMITVAIQDVNEAPVLQNQRRSVYEIELNVDGTYKSGSNVSDVVGDPLTASDPDNADLNNLNKQTLTFSIAGGGGNKYFTVDGPTGQVQIAQIPNAAETSELNFEATAEYTLTINVEDDGVVATGTTTTLTTTATLIIDILDIPETPIAPDFTLPTSVLESALVGTSVGTYDAAYDPDNVRTPGTDSLTYVYHGTNADHAYFTLDINTGSIATAKLLDFETKQSHTLNVRVMDSTGLFDDAVVTIDVEDVSESPSVITGQNAYFTENSASNTNAMDAVSGNTTFNLGVLDEDDTSFTYTIISTVPITDMFGMSSSGAMTLVAARLNYEARSEYVVTVRAIDAAGNSGDGDVTVHISNANDAPYYTATDASYTYILAENSPTNTSVNAPGTICVKDEDINPDGTPTNSHTFSVKSQSPSNVVGGMLPLSYVGCVASLQMKVTTTAPFIDLNFETPGGARFDITVSVTDNGTPPLTADCGIVITLSNQNDPPVLNDITFSIGETAISPAVIDTIVATDQDLGQPTESLSYVIASGNECGGVAIFDGLSSNNLMVLKITDWSAGLNSTACGGNVCNGYIQECAQPSGGAVLGAGDTFVLSVRVTDAFMGIGATDTASVTVQLTEENNPPDYSSQCTGGTTTRTVPEDASLNDPVTGGAVSATDSDGPGSLTYTIIAGNVGDQFSVDVGGIIKVNSANTLDFENTALRSFSLGLKVSDGLGASTSCTVTVSVTDVNECKSSMVVFFIMFFAHNFYFCFYYILQPLPSKMFQDQSVKMRP